jgi:putative ABC transport system substrate-binding protein
VSQADATRNIDAFRQGLRDLGQVEGPGLSIETRFSEGKDERLPALAEELTKQKVDVIVTTSAGRRLSWTRS